MVLPLDAFRIVLTEEQNLLLKQNYCQDSQLPILFSSSDTELFFFYTRKFTENSLKNHYMVSDKTFINNAKSICKRQIRNRQDISRL